MQLILYKTDSADNVINKTLSDPLTMEINLRCGVDISAPLLRLQLDVDLSGYNYAQIPDLNRYYFINDVKSVTLDIWQLGLSVDVLESYKAEIMTSNARYNRNLKTGDYQTVSLGGNVKTNVVLFESSQGLPEGSTLILSTVGEGA